ncbi:GxxExxY protein [Treponema denticola]|uniref:GxxExxY protein n=1 Tax=Treponema denticola TaxID=158 RepID=UPI0020A5CA2F|nr:GxxExxY protein [Treponema denticola]UTC93131.1 GxxExxY protein [Treponema denticola]UTC98155.1 GxxExxY protein [Treponema denticola]
MTENEIATTIIDKAMEVHKFLGPGLLESAYESCLFYELIKTGLKVDRQKPMPILYKDISLDTGYRIDLMVEDKVIVELKSVDSLTNIHIAQVLTYLKLSNCRLGLLINFNVKLLKTGIKRIANEL